MGKKYLKRDYDGPNLGHGNTLGPEHMDYTINGMSSLKERETLAPKEREGMMGWYNYRYPQGGGVNANKADTASWSPKSVLPSFISWVSW